MATIVSIKVQTNASKCVKMEVSVSKDTNKIIRMKLAIALVQHSQENVVTSLVLP